MSHRARRRRGGRQAIASGAGFLRPPGVRWRRSLLVQPGAGCLVTPDWGLLPAAPVDDHARSRSRKKFGEWPMPQEARRRGLQRVGRHTRESRETDQKGGRLIEAGLEREKSQLGKRSVLCHSVKNGLGRYHFWRIKD
jgi:hypothetical protein